MPLIKLIPDEPKQALRMRRFLLAAGSSAMVIFLYAVCYVNGLLSREVLIQVSIITSVLVAGFFVAFRSGFNTRFRDPSLTAPGIIVATFTILYVMYHADRIRGVLLMVYLMPFLFGVFRLNTRQLMQLALVVIAAYGVMVTLAAYNKPAVVDSAVEVTRFAVLATVLPWFATLGGYVWELRMQVHESNRKLQVALDRMRDIALHDELTGVFNRRYLMEALRIEQARAERTGQKLALCIFDLDHFKQINDKLGHAVGDEVLRLFADTAKRGLRGGEVFGRFGGEEFLLLLPQTTAEGAIAIAERIRASVAQTTFLSMPPDMRVTVTAGVTLLEIGEDPAQALHRADQALYRGKAQGRNRVEIDLFDPTAASRT